MADVGGPLEYYLRSVGSFLGYWHLLAIFSIASGVFLLFPCLLNSQGKPQQNEKPIHGVDAGHRSTALLHIDVVLAFCMAGRNAERVETGARVVYYTMSLQLFILYMAAATFYSKKNWATKIAGSFRLHSLYLIPMFCLAFVLSVSHVAGGTSVAIGDISWVHCEDVGIGEGKTASGDPLPFEVTCTEEYASVYPLTMSNVALGPLTRVLLFIPLIGAIVATVALSRSKVRIDEQNDANLSGEVRAVRLGFIGKTAMQITTTLILFWMVATIGESPSLETNVFNPNLTPPACCCTYRL